MTPSSITSKYTHMHIRVRSVPALRQLTSSSTRMSLTALMTQPILPSGVLPSLTTTLLRHEWFMEAWRGKRPAKSPSCSFRRAKLSRWANWGSLLIPLVKCAIGLSESENDWTLQDNYVNK